MIAESRRKSLCRGWIRLGVLAFGITTSALALDPRLSLTQYIHTSWTQSDGVPLPEIWNLAQPGDGYLWISTSQGVLRFDGNRFGRWTPRAEPPLETIRSVAPSKDGGLWLGTIAGLRKFQDGRISGYIDRPGLNSTDILSIKEDQSGRLWVAGILSGSSGLAILENGTARPLGIKDGLPPTEVYSVFVDADGAIWARTAGGFCRWSGGGAGHFVASPPPYSQSTPPGKPQIKKAKVLLRDKDGNLWIGTQGGGLYCVRGDSVQHFTALNGLSSDTIASLTEDREGNIWVGTSRGLDRFREPKVARWSTLQGLSGNLITAVCASRSGDVWVASFGGGLNCLRHDRVLTPADIGPALGSILSLFEDSDGTLWAGTMQGLLHQVKGQFVRTLSEDGLPFHSVVAMARAGNTLWLLDMNGVLGTIRNGRTVRTTVPGIPPGKVTSRLASGVDEALWLGYHEGGVTRFAHGAAEFFGPETGLAEGDVQTFATDSLDNLWVGTTQGLSRFRDGRWTTWTAREGIPDGGVLALIDDRKGSLWTMTRNGIAPLDFTQLNQTSATRPQPLHFTNYGPSDGLRTPDRAGVSNPRIALSPDGRIWGGTSDGVGSINPAGIRMNPVPPPVAIEQVSVDGNPLAMGAGEAEIRGQAIQFDYTALSLSVPESIRFRYKLGGSDGPWIDARNQRQIVYANLSPGHYRFTVTACNNDGVWNTTGAGFAFWIPPRFYQTWWFAVLCIGSMGVAAYGVHRLRIRQLRSKFQLVLQERARLSRELHDTVLQGFAGVVYQLEAASRQMTTAPDISKNRIDRALEQADQSLREAREALSCLRLSALEDKTLADALKEVAAQILGDTSIAFDMVVRGRARELPYDAQATVYIIAREAMNNAMNHAEPKRVRLELEYAPNEVRLAVRDDGQGFDIQQAGQKIDHWGLAGMRERTRQVGGTLSIESAPGKGTKVELVVDLRLSGSRASQVSK